MGLIRATAPPSYQPQTGGQTVTQALKGDRSFGLVVRWPPRYRGDIDAMRNIRVNAPAGRERAAGQIA